MKQLIKRLPTLLLAFGLVNGFAFNAFANPAAYPAKAAQPEKVASDKPEYNKKYFLCKPFQYPIPSTDDVVLCTENIRTAWESSWLPTIQAKQKFLIFRQNTGSILQWVGVSGGAAAAALGISDTKNSNTTAIAIGSAAAVSAITGIIWKQDASKARIAKCTDILAKQYEIQASLEKWRLRANDIKFRESFLATVDKEFIQRIRPGLEGCMPGEWIYES
jgi:hypothetical protein